MSKPYTRATLFMQCIVDSCFPHVGEAMVAVLEGQGAPHDLVFLDPPYELSQDALADDLTALAGRGWLAPGATLVIERSGRSPEPALPDGVVATGDRRYGDTRLWFARAP